LAVVALTFQQGGDNLSDLQLPDGTHVGSFFGTPLSELVQQRQNVATASTLDSGKHACAGAGNPFGELGDLFFAEKGESPRKQLENG